ncbi:MAG: glycosyltransferase family 39 protein [Anaerolineales bacterium]
MVEQRMQQTQSHMSQWLKPMYLGWIIVVLGGLLRVRQYFSGRSLWRDEAGLALNIVGRNFAGLTQPLGYEQGAPVGFLFLEKILTLLFGNYDYVMRLIPLVSGILSVYFFYRIAQVHIKGALFGTLLFAISFSLVYYSSELKQYSSDVMIVLLLVFLASRCLRQEANSKDFLTLGIIGMISIWISHPAAFVLAGIGLALFLAVITKRAFVSVKWLFILAGMWVLSFGLEYLISLRYLAADDYLLNYWENAFMPLPPGGTRAWFVRTYGSFLLTTFNRTDQIISLLMLILVPVGALSLLYRDKVIGIIVISPFFIALLASGAHKYPLWGRLTLFLVPFALLLIAEGLGGIYWLIAKWNIWLARVAYALPAFVLFFLPFTGTWEAFLHPPVSENIRPVLQYVAEHYQEEDILYVYHTSGSVFEYYAPFYELEHIDALLGRNDPAKRIALKYFYEDAKTLKGQDRVWFIFSGIVDCGGCEGDMQAFYVNYLDERGTMLDHVEATGANAYLYDINP